MSVEIDIHTFVPNDFSKFVPQKMQEKEYKLFIDKGFELLEYIEEENNTVTVELNGEVIAVFGTVPLPDKGCNGWLFFSKNVGPTGMIVSVRVFKSMFAALEDMGYEWMQTCVRMDFPEGERLVEMLGFTATEVIDDPLGDGTQYKYWMKVF
tara:strand:+ start:1895 stop:2350 length:456 start_codon:yes stop_codon:yes gene_type:complete